MNYLRTTLLLAALTALFMGIGYLFGGASGALVRKKSTYALHRIYTSLFVA